MPLPDQTPKDCLVFRLQPQPGSQDVEAIDYYTVTAFGRRHGRLLAPADAARHAEPLKRTARSWGLSFLTFEDCDGNPVDAFPVGLLENYFCDLALAAMANGRLDTIPTREEVSHAHA